MNIKLKNVFIFDVLIKCVNRKLAEKNLKR